MAYNNPFTPPSLSGYNASPPSDDGQRTAANAVRWTTHLTKIGNPLKTYAQAIAAAITTAFDAVPAALNPRTDAEISEGVTPSDYTVDITDYSDPRRFGAVADSSTDSTTALQKWIDVAIAGGRAARLPGSESDGEYKITSPLSISGPIEIVGRGERGSRILTVDCNAFTVAAGIASVKMRGFRIAQSTRHTTTPNTLTAIDIQGTTASQCDYHDYRDLLIDGYQTPIQANAVRVATFDNIRTVFSQHGILSAELSDSVVVSNCKLTGGHLSSSYGVRVGDGSAAAEGWIITNNVIYGFARGIWGHASSNCNAALNIIDQFGEFGLLLSSGSAAIQNWTVALNYIAALGTADSGIYCANSVAPSMALGHRIIGNNIFPYSGSTLTNGVLVDGSSDANVTVLGNTILATTYDCRLATGSGHIVNNNRWLGPGYSSAVSGVAYGDQNIGTVIGTTMIDVASAAALTLPVGPRFFNITGTTDITSIVTTGLSHGVYVFRFAGALTFTQGGNITLNASASFVTTANDIITLAFDGTTFMEIARSSN